MARSGLSLSTEIGFQRSAYSTTRGPGRYARSSTRAIGRWYFAVNPALERTFHGPDVSQGFRLRARVPKISYDFTRVVSARDRSGMRTTAPFP